MPPCAIGRMLWEAIRPSKPRSGKPQLTLRNVPLSSAFHRPPHRAGSSRGTRTGGLKTGRERWRHRMLCGAKRSPFCLAAWSDAPSTSCLEAESWQSIFEPWSGLCFLGQDRIGGDRCRFRFRILFKETTFVKQESLFLTEALDLLRLLQHSNME
jgi:hypothetical protein